MQTSWQLEPCTKPVNTIDAPLSRSLDNNRCRDAGSDKTTISSVEPVSIATPLSTSPSTNGHDSITMGDCCQSLDSEASNVCQLISVLSRRTGCK